MHKIVGVRCAPWFWRWSLGAWRGNRRRSRRPRGTSLRRMGCRRPSEPSMTTSQWRRSVTGDAPGRQNAGGSSHIMRSSLRIRLLRGSSNPILPHYQVRLMISRRVAAPTGEGNPIPSGQGCVGTRYGRASAGEIDRVPVSTRHPTCEINV